MTKLTTERLEKLQDDLLQFQDSYSDPADKENYDIFVDALHVIDEFKAAKEKLLAYEQAGKETKIYQYQSCLFNDENGETDWYWDDCDKGFFEQYDPFHRRIVYAAPVLPKQPVKPVMFIDGDISSDDAEKLAAVIREFGNEPASAQPVIPERPELRYGNNVLWFLNELAAFDASDIDSDDFDVYGEGRNGMEGCATISITELAADAAKLLSAQPVIPEQAKPVAYTDNRNLKSLQKKGCATALLWLERNSEVGDIPLYTEVPAQPVSEPYKLPSGYALVPCKLTAENGAKSCMIGEFTEQTEITCPECFGDDECETCDGSGMIEVTVPVSWTTIKDIWAKGIEHFAAAPAQESE